MLSDLVGKVALVTGAASGIGRAMAEAFAAEGMKLVIADLNVEALAETEKLVRAQGGEVLSRTLDTRDRAGWERLLDAAEAALGPVQLLCNNAGVTVAPTPALDLSDEAWDWVIGVNLKGTFIGATLVGQRLRAAGLPGHIVNTASIQGLFAAPDFAAYNASKFAIVGLSETLAIELAAYDIGVSVLCPGPTRTNMFASSQKLAPHLVAPVASARTRVGFTHYLTPDDVAAQVVAAVRANRLHIVTHPEYGPLLQARAEALAASIAPDADPAAIANIAEVEAVPFAAYQAYGQGRGG